MLLVVGICLYDTNSTLLGLWKIVANEAMSGKIGEECKLVNVGL